MDTEGYHYRSQRYSLHREVAHTTVRPPASQTLLSGCTQHFPLRERCKTPICCYMTGLLKSPCLLALCATATCPGPHPCIQMCPSSPLTHPRAPQSQQAGSGADLPSMPSLLHTLLPISGGKDTTASLNTQQLFTCSQYLLYEAGTMDSPLYR